MEHALLIACLPLAIWRLSYMLVYEDLPYQVMLKARYYLHTWRWSRRWLGDALECIYCTSIYVSIVIVASLNTKIGQAGVYLLAASGSALMLHRLYNLLGRLLGKLSK